MGDVQPMLSSLNSMILRVALDISSTLGHGSLSLQFISYDQT